MIEINKNTQEYRHKVKDKNSFSMKDVFKLFILYWKWFVVSIIACIAVCFVYLRYTTPTYQMDAKLLIKDDGNGNRRNRMSGIMQMEALGMMANSYGVENEIEILNSNILARQIVENLKLYVTYKEVGNFKNRLIYKTQPVNVDMDKPHLDRLNVPMKMEIRREGNKYVVKGKYNIPIDIVSSKGPYEIKETFDKLPAQLGTGAGIVYFTQNKDYTLKDGEAIEVVLMSPQRASYAYQRKFSAASTSKMSAIASLTIRDAVPQRAEDYLYQLTSCYNALANEDKNEIASRTEEFINTRLEKINRELGDTEASLESFKRRNKVVELGINAQATIGNTNLYEQKLMEARTQLELINTLKDFIKNSKNEYQVFPANIGLDDASSNSLISKYNEVALQRSHLLTSASESSPSVIPLTKMLNNLYESIEKSLEKAYNDQTLKKRSLEQQYNMYSGRIQQTPEQERVLTQIGRQQEVKAGLFLMLLQKREENSISLASTVDKGKIIETPQFRGKVSPKSSLLMLIALIIGLIAPLAIILLRELLRYKIEGREDVIKLTDIPVIADVAVASNDVKGKGDIVVHENSNSLMEEIFRYLRTNLQFMLKEKDKVIMFTSTVPGEGKTFNAANTAASFALLNKKVILIGLDIRKPRLGEIFGIKDTKKGITNLLVKENPSEEDIFSVIDPSGVISNLDLMLAGPIPPNPAELIAGKGFDKVFEVLREKYDYIIIDTAPISLVTDTFMVARAVDATVCVCRADYSEKSSFNIINEAHDTNKLPNMSIVINGIDMSKKKYGYAYGVGKYGKYGRYGYAKHSYGNTSYGSYTDSHYGNTNDNSIKK